MLLPILHVHAGLDRVGPHHLGESRVKDENILNAGNGITRGNRRIGRIVHAAKGGLGQNLQRVILWIKLGKIDPSPRPAASSYDCGLGVVAFSPARYHESAFKDKRRIEDMRAVNSDKAGNWVVLAG